MKALNATTGSCQRQKGLSCHGWLAVVPGEVSDNGAESRSPARVALETSTAVLPSTEEWMKSSIRAQIEALKGRQIYYPGLEQEHGFVIHQADQ